MYGNKVFISTNDAAHDRAQSGFRRGGLGGARRRADRSGDRHAVAQGAGLLGRAADDQDPRRQGTRAGGRKHRRLSSAPGAGSAPGTSIPASWRGAPSPSRPPASPARRPGRTTTMPGASAAPACGRPAPSIRRPTSSITAPATPSRPSIRNSARATTSTPPAPSRFDADTGKIVWYFQETPNEHWDFDTPSPKMLYEVTINGETRKVVANFSRNGFFYTLDRASGQFLRADQYQEKVTWTKGIDPKTGKPVDYDPKPRRAALRRHRRAARQARPGGLPLVERRADLLPADLRRQAHDRLCRGRRGLHRRAFDQDADGRKQGLGRHAHVLPGGGPAATAHGALWALDVRTGKVVAKATVPDRRTSPAC